MGARVLVLDDEPWQLAWISDVAKAAGGEVVFVSTYEDATKEFDTTKPNIAIVDIRIGDVSEPLQGATLKAADPTWTGLRFLRFIRAGRTASDVMIYGVLAAAMREL